MRRELSRAKNWYSAMGILFIVVGSVTIIETSLIWGFGFAIDFILSPEINREKVSTGMICFGLFMVFLGFRRSHYEDTRF